MQAVLQSFGTLAKLLETYYKFFQNAGCFWLFLEMFGNLWGFWRALVALPLFYGRTNRSLTPVQLFHIDRRLRRFPS